jgi:hypothetical protein
MSREHVLAISILMTLVILLGVAHAGPRITDKSYWPNEVGPSSYRNMRMGPAPYAARAMLGSKFGPAAQAPRAAYDGQYGCRYQGGPKFPMTCSMRP